MLPILSPENSTIPFWVSSGKGHLIGRHLTADNSIPPPLLPDVIITLKTDHTDGLLQVINNKKRTKMSTLIQSLIPKNYVINGLESLET